MRLRNLEKELAGLTRAEIVAAIREAARKKRGGSAAPRRMTMRQLADRLGPDYAGRSGSQRVRRDMKRLGIAVLQSNGRYVVYLQDLKEADRKLWNELELEAAGR